MQNTARTLGSRKTTVAIIGGGITGLSVAFHLAERGVEDVTVYERTGIGAEASGVQPGGVRQQWRTRVNCLMARESIAFYSDVAELLGAATRPRLERCGYAFVAHSEARLAELGEDVSLQNGLGIESTLVEPDELAELVPGLDVETVQGAAYCSDDGYVDKPQAIVEGFAEAARRRGVAIEIGRVDGLRQEGGGWHVQNGRGEVVVAEHVVVAAGYDTPALLEPLGIAVPIRKEPRYLFLSDPIRERLLEPLVVSTERRFAAKHLANGRVLASDLTATHGPEADLEARRAAVKEMCRDLLPILEFVSYPLVVEGYYDVTPDNQAIIGPVDGLGGLWLAAGFSGHGFMMAPSVGRCLAGAIAGDAPDPLVEPLSIQRFANNLLIPDAQAF